MTSKEKQVEQLTTYMANFVSHIGKVLPDDIIAKLDELAEKEDSVTAALLHLVQCGGSTSGSQILLESLAQGLAGAMAQKLLRRQDEAGRVAAYEVLVADAGVRSLIAENRIQQLDTSAGAEKERGRVQMDDAIYNLYMKSCITSETAIAGAKDPEDMRRKVRLF